MSEPRTSVTRTPTALGRLVVLAGVGAAAFVAGYYTHRQHIPSRLIGWLRAAPAEQGSAAPGGMWFRDDSLGGNGIEGADDQLESLRSIGYLSGYEEGAGEGGVRFFDEQGAFEGLNLYTSGHAPEAILMDMGGSRLHTWSYEFRDIWPDRELGDFLEPEWWRRAYLYPNGDLLAIYDWLGMIKLDRDSNLLWSFSGRAHHDIEVLEDGRIYVLEAEERSRPELRPDGPVFDDLITVLDPDGQVLRQVSVLDAFENSRYALLLDRMPKNTDDILHTNTLEVLDGRLADRSPVFKAGNVLISPRNIDVIAVVDMEEERVVWALTGMWSRQHDPEVLDNGNLLLFDNLGHQGASKVIELDPLSQAIVWSYEGTPVEAFRSTVLGASQRLPNGNTLITESTRGRAFEVAADGTIVWEFVNPERAGDDDGLIAVLCEMLRLPPDFPVDWLEGS